MAKILLDYFFPISVIESVPAANTAFLKQCIVVAKPKSGQEGNVGTIYECTSMTQVAVRTDNTNAEQLFSAGMTRVFILLASTLDIGDYLDEAGATAWTILISDDFVDSDLGRAASGTATISTYANLLVTSPDVIAVAGVSFVAQSGSATLGTATFRAATSNNDTAASLAAQINGHATTAPLVTAVAVGAVVTITAKIVGTVGNSYTLTYTDNGAEAGASVSGGGFLNQGVVPADFGSYDGVVGFSSDDADVCQEFGTPDNRCGFFGSVGNGAKNMFFAFGKLLSNLTTWNNQQYITMPVNDDVDELGEANSLFDDKVSFVINDTQYGNRLALFAAGGKAIVAPYIGKNLRVDLQSRALQWIAANQPQYTLANAALLENRLQEDVIKTLYVDRGLIEAGVVSISLLQDNFVANGEINIAEPKALWRIFGQMQSTL